MTDRPGLLDRLRSAPAWDVAIIGGGSTGLGAAVDAASRGYRTVLIEAVDLARGTSSRSTKLVHGGVRYLAQGHVGLVREALAERAILLRNAPHLAWPADFLIPTYSRLGAPSYGLGLGLYDLLAGRDGLGRARIVDRAEAGRLAPTLRGRGLRGGVVYRDGQFDDARLAVALALTVLDLGGLAINAMPARGLIKHGGRVAGVEAVDAETGETFRIPARAVINATGVEVDAIRRLDEPGSAPIVRPSRGSHLVLDRACLPGPAAVMIPKTDDGRVLFAIPWHGRAILGTTDTPVDRAEPDPAPAAGEVGFLLDHAGRYFDPAPTPADVRSVFAGLRPLLGRSPGARTARLSREHAVIDSASGLVTITGGKWTTYRRMGRDAVDRAAAVAGLPDRPSATEQLRIHGATEGPSAGPFAFYGSNAPDLARLAADRPDLAGPIHPDLPDAGVAVAWAARRELARTVEDVLARRTRALLVDAKAAIGAAPRVAAILAAELGRDADWQAGQVASFGAVAARYLPPA